MEKPDISYKISASDLELVLNKTLGKMVQDLVLNPYCMTTVSVTSACEIINVSRKTMYNYIKFKKLIPFKSDDRYKCYRFTVKSLLEFNMARAKNLI